MNYKIIFDTETTGLRCYKNQVAQLSYVMIDDKYEVKSSKNFYFTVEYMEDGASRANGLDEEILKRLSNGRKFKDSVSEIYNDFLNADVLIAHNLEFDLGFLKEEFKRLNYDIDKMRKNKKYFCTMESYTMFMQIEHEYYGLKYPRLDEVMDYLGIKYTDIEKKTKLIFNTESTSYHDSRFDVIATLLAYEQVKNIDKIMFCNDVYNAFGLIEKHVKRIRKEYIKEDMHNLNSENLENVYSMLLNKDKPNLKASLNILSRRIERMIEAIEKEYEKKIDIK